MSLPLELGSLHKEQQALDSLERQLICPICLEVFTKPVVILPCQHNLCRKCANDLYQARSNLVGAGGRFRCPSCRQEVTLDRHGVYGLQRNLLVENIIDVYKQESTSSRPPPKPTGKLTCEEHEDEMVNIYCLSCQVPTCSLCKVFGAHKSCKVAPLPEIYQQQKAELSDGVDLLVAANDRVQAFINELEETCSNVEHNSKSQKQTLVEKFDRMYAILEERRKIMTQRITYEQEEKTGHARSLVRSYGESVGVSTKLVEAALHTIVEPEQAAFLQSARGMIEKVIEATGSSTVETLEPGYENMDHYKVNFNAEERALYQLDFIKVVEEVPEDPEPEPESDPEPEPECEPDLELEPEPILEYQAAPAPVAASVSSLILEPESVLEHLAMPVPVAAPVSSLILEPESVLEHLAMPVPVAAPMSSLILEPESVLEHLAMPVPVAPPVAAPVPILVSAPEPVVEPKPEGWGMKDQGAELTEDVRSQAESYADPTKEVLCDQEGFDTQQDEPGPEAEAETELWQEGHDAAGDCDIQEGLLADISEDTRLLYPSWYKRNSWQVVSPPSSLATSNIEPLGVPESTPQPAREAQPQALSLPQPQPLPSHMPMSVWMDNSCIPMPPDDQVRELTWESTGTGSMVVGPHGFVPPAGEGTPGLGERAAGSGGSVTSMTSTPLQTGSAGSPTPAGLSSPPGIINESPRLSFYFSWLNALSKKKK